MYLWLAIAAYFLFAINAVIDKFLLGSKRIGHPAVYAFGVGILSLTVLVFAPFGFYVPDISLVLLSLTSGVLFAGALLVYFGVLKMGEASRIVPVVGGLVPAFTLIFAFWFLAERLQGSDLWAAGFLIIGTILMRGKGRNTEGKGGWIVAAVFTAVLFALSFSLLKEVFEALGFINGLIWTRLGTAAGALFFLLIPDFKKAIFQQFQTAKIKTKTLFVVGQVLGALAGLLQTYAIALGSVTIVNALAGTQFVFLFVLSTVLSLWYPEVVTEKISRAILTRKIIAICLIAIGVAAIAI